MRVLISGSTGLIGSRLVPALEEAGHEVYRLVRSEAPKGDRSLRWAPYDDVIERDRLAEMDAVVHLAGENIMGRWTEAKKREIRRSRVKTTAFLAEVLASLPDPPRVWVTASAVGYYGDRGDEVLAEDSAAGQDFLARVCRDWEKAAEPAVEAGIRVVHLRFGAVLTPRGGALAKMLPPFRMGLGGRVGDGRQYVSWISLEDAVGVVRFVLENDDIAGPVNVVAPNPVTNAELAQTLGTVLHRPAAVPVPKFALRTVFGDLADGAMLASQRVNPRILTQHEYHFKDPQLAEALRRMLNTK